MQHYCRTIWNVCRLSVILIACSPRPPCSFRLYTLRVLLYDTWNDFFRAIGEVIVVMGCLYYICE